MPLEPLSNVAILVKTSEIMPKDIIAYAAFKARLDKKKNTSPECFKQNWSCLEDHGSATSLLLNMVHHLRTVSSLTLVWGFWVWRDFVFNSMFIAWTAGRHHLRRKFCDSYPDKSWIVFQPKIDGPDGETSGWNSPANIGQMSGQMIVGDPASLTKNWLIHCGQLSAQAHEQAVISYCINMQAMQGASIGSLCKILRTK